VFGKRSTILQNIHIGSGVHQASYLMGTRGALSCGQSGWGVKLIILHLVLRLWMGGATPTPCVCLPRCELYFHLSHLQYLCTKHVNTSSYDSDVYSGEIWTKIFMVFLSLSRQMLGQYLKSHCNGFLPHPFKVITHNHAVVWCYVDWLTGSIFEMPTIKIMPINPSIQMICVTADG